MHESLKNSDGTLKRYARRPPNQVRRPTRPNQETSAPESMPTVAPGSQPLLLENTNLDSSHDETYRANIYPDAVSPLSEQHESCQSPYDNETQFELFVQRELLMLDRCSAEYTLYKEGRCSVASDGTVCDPDGVVLSRSEPEMKKPVHSIAIPDGFAMSPWGKLLNDYGKPKTILGKPLLPVSILRADGAATSGVRFMYLDERKQFQRIDLLFDRVIQDYKTVKTSLYKAGIECPEAQEGGLLSYMSASLKIQGLRVVHQRLQAGFVSEYPCYVWVGRSIYKAGYSGPQHELLSAPGEHDAIHSKGTLQEWQEKIASSVKESPTMLIAIMASLSNVFMELSNTGTMIFHFYGASSCGKTTLLQVGQSVSGVASDPSGGPATAIVKWDATLAGLIAKFQQRTGIGICLDEVGSLSSRDLLQYVYAATGGQSRLRSNIHGTCDRSPLSSVVCGLSSGEESMKEKLERSKEGTKGGIFVRVIDIEMTAEDVALAGESLELTRRRVNGLKTAASQYYGTAMPAYIQALVNMPDIDTPADLAVIFAAKREECQEWLMSRSGLEAPPPLADRGAGCFANVMAAGRLAVELGILPFDVAYVDNAVLVCFRRWIMSMEGIMDDVTREAYRLLDKLSEQRRKIRTGKPSMEVREILGFTEDGKLYVEMTQLQKLLTSKPKLVMKWLRENGYIVHYADGRYVKEIVIDSLPGNYYVFSVNKVFQFRSPLFDERTESLVQPCSTGSSTVLGSPAPSFTRSATSETGCVMVESSPDMSEISVEVEKF
ncbi:DUF927 domain-containing protein [Aeromonas dhakensis]|uniref:DUF927 domain-containing protein n=1 Tax=Aeromonas dhakensis TaxID=196024 RepID=UPI00215844D0|nr:DUF927 domain-containing protein [Aeromonas dhakensis]MCR6741101.1 DUF927 domain-containing protein [Aeromonas dhakensis]